MNPPEPLSIEDAPHWLEIFRDLYGKRGLITLPDGSPGFICEGRILVQQALGAHRQGELEVVSILASPSGFTGLEIPAAIEKLAASADFIAALAGFTFHRGQIACLRIPPPKPVPPLARRLLVLPELVDFENLALLLRSAAGLGVDGVYCGRGPELFDRRVVRVSMGACWRIPVSRPEDLLGEVAAWRRRVAGQVWAAALRPGAVDSRLWDPGEHHALVLGQEGPGLPPEWLDFADGCVCIPMAPGVDSLNVAAAGAILLHAGLPRP
ncbi:MAG: hypothetical protein RL095_3989 [Verrucomicrobiota bacterium]|jgi:tRNA G18 (ribose-2'-O)-methylase SpoU